MSRTPSKLSLTLLVFALAMAAAQTSRACSVPVFRYALERWVADPYQVVVFHRGALSAELEPLAESLRSGRQVEQRGANIEVRFVDLDAEPDDESLALWNSLKTDVAPWMTVLYPHTARVLNPVMWSGPFAPETVEQLLDSPLRQEIARRTLKGDTAVWVLLECGNQQADDDAAETLQAKIAHAAETLELPDIEEEDIKAGLLDADPADLKIAFSMIRLSRDDPAEKLFAEMLLGSEDDLGEFNLPMAFPVFGRGRVLYALVGAGINGETIQQACTELIGPCTCQVKEQNPGIDLLMSVNWNALVVPQMNDNELPPLTGAADLLAANNGGADTPTAAAANGSRENTDTANGGDQQSAEPTDPVPSGGSVGQETTAGAQPAASTGNAEGSPQAAQSSGIVRNTAILIGLCAVGVIAVSLFLVTRRG